jgi:uncharacterized repeat protein (TIGR01451 family)
MTIGSHRNVAAFIATIVIMLMVGIIHTPVKAQVGAPVTVTIIGEGRVRGGAGWSDKIDCPDDCTGATMGFAQLFAEPADGWSAVGWGGLCSGGTTKTRTTCVANFFAGGNVTMTFEVPVPEIDVRGGPAVLLAANGDITPDPNNGTDFGQANVSGSTIDHTFSVWNTGTGALTLNGMPLVSLSGANAADFTLMSPPTATVPSDSMTTFVLRFDPSAVGERIATVTIANDDSDEGAYSFSIRGTGYDAITSGPPPLNYSESIDGDLKDDTVYVPCSVSGFADEFVLGVGVNRWTGTVGVTGNGANQNDMFRALLPTGAYIDRITYQRESWKGSLAGYVLLSLTDAGSRTLMTAGGTGAVYAYPTPTQNSILTLMVIADFNPEPVNWTITINVVGSVQGTTGPILTYESASPPEINISEGQLGTACGRFSDAERDAVTLLPGPLTASPVLSETGPLQTFADPPANSSGRWEWLVQSVDGPRDSQDLVLRAVDNNPAGSSSSQLNFQLNVANVAPKVNKPTVSPDPSNEIATATARATWSDPGVLDVATCTVEYGDGSAPVAGVANFNKGNGVCTGPAHTYADNGTYVISIVVTDKDSAVGSNSYTYVVNNLSPVISSVTNTGPIKENKSALITVNATDPAGTVDPITYAFDCNNDSVYEKGPQAQNSVSCTFPVFGSHPVNVEVRDDDGGLSTDSTLVTVVKNSPPVANNQNISTDEEISIATTLTASDVNGDSLTYSLIKGPDNGSLSGTPPRVTYRPNPNYAGIDSFTFNANDGEANSNAATINVTVNPVNDAPLANDDSFNTNEDTSFFRAVAGNDSDIDGDTLAYALVTNVSYGTLTLGPRGSFIYTPSANYQGSDSFTYQVDDGNNGKDTAKVNITVSAVNDAPKVTNDAADGVEDAAITVTVLTNDHDSADGDLLNLASLSVISGPTSGATAVNAVNGTIIYSPTANFYGSDSFTYRVCDNGLPLPALCGSATVTLIIAIVTDDDDDADGVADMNDAFPLDANESVDTDGDGSGDNGDSDDDNDGVADGNDAFPFDASESVDTDGDGTGNIADSDDDGDGVADGDDAYPLNPAESVDTDGDGTGDNADSDDDADGIADGDDTFPLDQNETTDTDGDGTGNNADMDDDGDGVADGNDAFPLDPTESVDTDGDGTGDNADTDDDNDTVADGDDDFPADASESADTDNDGTGDNADDDDDNDGVADSDDALPLDASESVDTDKDGTGNNADTDDDADGVEDGDDAFPLDPNESVDTDNDGTGDNADSDDDNDGVADRDDAFPLDSNESVDTDNDGTGNNADTDDDGDGTGDSDDAFPLDATGSVDTDGDGIGNNTDSDDDGDGVADGNDALPLDANENVDTDGDGTGNNADTDDDGDGTEDGDDAFPFDANEQQDSDQDGVGDNVDNCPAITNANQVDTDGNGQGDACDPLPSGNGNDADGDGVSDAADNCPTISNAGQENADSDAQGNACDADDDDDGIADGDDVFPLDPTESIDTDGDGTGNNADTDDDGDGIADTNDAFPLDPNESVDTDGDNTGNNADTDNDNDGVDDAQGDNCPLISNADQANNDADTLGDACDTDDDNDGTDDNTDTCPLTATIGQDDSDADGQGDACDSDDDGDGSDDILDNCPFVPNPNQADADGDGRGDACDGENDSDGDGLSDADDNCPADPNLAQTDTDDDGEGDACDADDDGDGLNDNTPDNCPLVANPDQLNTDGDGQGDACDPDDDEDGIADGGDNCPLVANADQLDSDNDGQGNVCDTDDDNDSVDDNRDAFPLDPNEQVDSDNDGVGDNGDNCPTIANAGQVNTGGDLSGDACDSDDDGDGVMDGSDAFPLDPSESVDNDGDGTGNNADTDDDGDGTDDSDDAFPLDPNEQQDSDSDGIGDNVDNCPAVANASQVDTDGDALGDACDKEEVPLIDLELDVAVDNITPQVGSEVIFTLIVANTSASNASGVTIKNHLPDGYTYLSDDSGTKYSEGIWTIGNLAAGTSATLKITVQVNASGEHINYAQVQSANEQDSDSTPGNDSHNEDDDDSETVVVVIPAAAAIGGKLWFDTNINGLQDRNEPAMGNVEVQLYKVNEVLIASAEDVHVATVSTNADGDYLFTNLEPGDYYVLYTAPRGYGFTQEGVDSDVAVPQVIVTITDRTVGNEADTTLLYTLSYTNTDLSKTASDVVITATVPAGTSFVAESSTSGWSCTSADEGGVCSFTISFLEAQDAGALTFVVKLRHAEVEMPKQLTLMVGLTNGSPARTEIVTLVAGEAYHFVSSGLVRPLVVTHQTLVQVGPTNLPDINQPKQQRFLFLPAVQTQG